MPPATPLQTNGCNPPLAHRAVLLVGGVVGVSRAPLIAGKQAAGLQHTQDLAVAADLRVKLVSMQGAQWFVLLWMQR